MNKVFVVKTHWDRSFYNDKSGGFGRIADRKKEYCILRTEAYLIWHELVRDYPDQIIIEDGDSICIYERKELDRREKIRLDSRSDILRVQFEYLISYH
jgi:hypothetical protein